MVTSGDLLVGHPGEATLQGSRVEEAGNPRADNNSAAKASTPRTPSPIPQAAKERFREPTKKLLTKALQAVLARHPLVDERAQSRRLDLG